MCADRTRRNPRCKLLGTFDEEGTPGNTRAHTGCWNSLSALLGSPGGWPLPKAPARQQEEIRCSSQQPVCQSLSEWLMLGPRLLTLCTSSSVTDTRASHHQLSSSVPDTRPLYLLYLYVAVPFNFTGSPDLRMGQGGTYCQYGNRIAQYKIM